MIGSNIRAARQAAGLTQKQLAAKAEITTFQHIGRWERNELETSLANLKKIAKALDKTLGELAGD